MITGIYIFLLLIFRKKEWTEHEAAIWAILILGVIEYILLLEGYYFI